MTRFEVQLSKAIRQSYVRTSAANNRRYALSSARFFQNWFRSPQHSYFFLFRKNLSVTNIQVAELLALVRTHARQSASPPHRRALQFMSRADFDRALMALESAFDESGMPRRDRPAALARLYSPLMQRIVILDMFFGSCALFLPPHVTLDLRRLCTEAGYIHSCGHPVYIRNTIKADSRDFESALRRHVRRIRGRRSSKRIFFSVYAHEDFTEFDRKDSELLRHGLDDVKVFVEKFHMGELPLTQVLARLRQHCARELEIAPPGNFLEVHGEARDNPMIDRTRTLWLIVDRKVDPHTLHAGTERYFICYDQLYASKQAFHLFDENKPGWTSHTTLPHSLAAAMINITRPRWPRHRRTRAHDPFVGTGTIWFELLRLPDVDPSCSDESQLTRRVVGDNARFFGLDDDGLAVLREHLWATIYQVTERLVGERRKPSVRERRAADAGIKAALEAYHACGSKRDGLELDPAGASKALEKMAANNRIIFYLLLRTRLRHYGALERKSKDFQSAFVREAEILYQQIDDLLGLRKAMRRDARRQGGVLCFEGKYSRRCTTDLHRMSGRLGDVGLRRLVKCMDVRNLKVGAYDLIVADPPYGLNVSYDVGALATLYGEMLRAMIRAMADGGQLVLALPEMSHAGMSVPFFVQKDVVVQQVIATAEELGREVVSPAGWLPQPGGLFRPPYFWESERSLRRAILHFWFRERRGRAVHGEE